MSAALITATGLAVAGLAIAFVLGFLANSGPDVLQHTTVSIFATLLTLLSHSMMMFYLIGKGRAVKDAVKEGGLSPEFFARISALRRPVFSQATLAIALTLATAVIGGGVDTRVIPPWIHAVLGFAAVVSNIMSLRIEIIALAGASRIVEEIDRLFASRSI